ncbi:uncharacterized protein DUF3679 [Thermolongibacillus altinsuensis]|jgi:hypothetical protein|uniref:Uncharacterized protein DUF3679 n=1 Tax=Thermolongibacillus altinsuensis TaxID=575256 RepID=A0A4R1QH15_9BACL|nr:YqxA family protein [Thermolongibacillus altinsuensis]TCL48875.1 uncharacterized protein DUF3679 [Thermolongibacillus altinsuensis]GMB07568.1 hypothetical protein B1no1_02780 [Thermolongibacillus altinsuensis]
MIKFTIQFLLTLVIFLFGVLLGMQQANEGMMKMKGYKDPDFQEVFHISKEETVLFGQSIEEKKEQLQRMETLNIFSEFGKKLAFFVHSVVQQMFSLLDQVGSASPAFLFLTEQNVCGKGVFWQTVAENEWGRIFHKN